MDDDQRRGLDLKLLVNVQRRDPLGGEVGPVGSRLRPFSGWIGLAGAITECLGSSQLDAAESSAQEDPNL